jgi:hypothetical protein
MYARSVAPHPPLPNVKPPVLKVAIPRLHCPEFTKSVESLGKPGASDRLGFARQIATIIETCMHRGSERR